MEARAYRTKTFRAGTQHAVPVPREWAYRSSGYGYECPTELTEVLCGVIPGVNTPGIVCTYPTEHNLVNFGFFVLLACDEDHPLALNPLILLPDPDCVGRGL